MTAPELVDVYRHWLYLQKCGPGAARSDAWKEADKRLAEALKQAGVPPRP